MFVSFNLWANNKKPRIRTSHYGYFLLLGQNNVNESIVFKKNDE